MEMLSVETLPCFKDDLESNISKSCLSHVYIYFVLLHFIAFIECVGSFYDSK